MLEEDRATFLNNVQKKLTATCYEMCGTKKKCQEVCFKKYLSAVNETNTAMRSNAYDSLSTIGYKAYPEDNIEHMLHHTNLIVKSKRNMQFALKRFDQI